MKEMPNVPTPACVCVRPGNPCECGTTERALRAWMHGTLKEPMTPEQREYCLVEIDSVEGYRRKDYENADDASLAAGVIDAWLEYCRDKGLC